MSQQIKDRIRKLLNLGNNAGATEAEATSALEMASALMLKYNIEIDPEEDELKVVKGSRILQGYDEPWHIACSNAAAMLFMCKNVLYNRGTDGYYFVGRKENVEMAGETMLFIIEQIEQLYKQHLPRGLSKGDRAEFRRTFKAAAASRCVSRAFDIVDSFKRGDNKLLEYTGSKALIVVDSIKQQLDDAELFLKQQNPDMKIITTRPTKFGNGTMTGFKAGEKVQLNRIIK